MRVLLRTYNFLGATENSVWFTYSTVSGESVVTPLAVFNLKLLGLVQVIMSLRPCRSCSVSWWVTKLWSLSTNVWFYRLLLKTWIVAQLELEFLTMLQPLVNKVLISLIDPWKSVFKMHFDQKERSLLVLKSSTRKEPPNIHRVIATTKFLKHHVSLAIRDERSTMIIKR